MKRLLYPFHLRVARGVRDEGGSSTVRELSERRSRKQQQGGDSDGHDVVRQDQQGLDESSLGRRVREQSCRPVRGARTGLVSAFHRAQVEDRQTRLALVQGRIHVPPR